MEVLLIGSIQYFDPCDLKIRPNDLKTGQKTYPGNTIENQINFVDIYEKRFFLTFFVLISDYENPVIMYPVFLLKLNKKLVDMVISAKYNS